jgi:tetratricopeptide (TPR) repeat protein
LGGLLELAGRTADAIAEYRQANNIDQNDVSVHLSLMRLLKASGKEDEAAAEAAFIAKIDPRLFASGRDMPEHPDAGAGHRDEIRRHHRH